MWNFKLSLDVKSIMKLIHFHLLNQNSFVYLNLQNHFKTVKKPFLAVIMHWFRFYVSEMHSYCKFILRLAIAISRDNKQ